MGDARTRDSMTPTRIVVNQSGEAVSPDRTNLQAQVIFVRDDGWSLGAPSALIDVARQMWTGKWVEEWRHSGAGWEKRWPLPEQARPPLAPIAVEQLTIEYLLDVTKRAASVLLESDGADEHAPLIRELSGIWALCSDVIGASHMGCAADVVILERGGR